MFRFVVVTLAFASVYALDIPVENPPPPHVEMPEFTMVPDAEGKLYRVNTLNVLTEPQPFFSVESDVIFELYTQQNQRDAQILLPGNMASVSQSNFNPQHPTRIAIHGWQSDGSLTEQFADAYFTNSTRNVNFIAVNWQYGSSTLNYPAARNRVTRVGGYVARLIDFLVRNCGLRLADLIVIGHSLGAHTAGIAGKRVTSGQLPKIVALDPAMPLFQLNRPSTRVAKGDARSVEIIHSNAGTLGFSSPLGDVSFYPNGGRSQPGCGIDLVGACAHSRAIEFYVESINSQRGFYSWNCESYDEMSEGNCNVRGRDMVRMGGDPGNQGSATGVFYLHTNRRSPFAMGRRR